MATSSLSSKGTLMMFWKCRNDHNLVNYFITILYRELCKIIRQHHTSGRVQRSARFLFPGCVYFFLALPGKCLAKQKNFLADFCTYDVRKISGFKAPRLPLLSMSYSRNLSVCTLLLLVYPSPGVNIINTWIGIQ